MSNLINPRLVNTSGKKGETKYSAIMSLSYGTVAPTPQAVAGLTFTGNSDLFQAQSLMVGIQPIPIRNIQLAFAIPEDTGGGPANLFFFMPDTGELISVPLTDDTAYLGSATFSVNILPSFQVQILRSEDQLSAMVGKGVVCLSTFERETYSL
jgi:hypothetical protein